jgi:hypothetical protein
MIERLRSKLLIAVAIAVCVATAAAGAAKADPVNHGLPVTLTCGSTVLDTVTNGNGEFTPAHDTNSTRVFIPVQFGPVTDVFTDADGITTTTTEPLQPPKGSANPANRTILDCTFHADVHGPNGEHLVVDGGVKGYFAK